ncbi:hypothetical protein EDD21DRAFT_116660 [Dissophora ornata]|nr:hypothetical protein EDD21DRAFT_116660 [Dissophora ornata]
MSRIESCSWSVARTGFWCKYRSVRQMGASLRRLEHVTSRNSKSITRVFSEIGSALYREECSRQSVYEQELSQGSSSSPGHLEPLQDLLQQPVSSPQLPSPPSHQHSSADDADALLSRVFKMVEDQRRAENGETERSKPVECPQFIMLPRDASLEDVWSEWFRGIKNRPSIREMDKWYQHRWRKTATKSESNANDALYLFKKHIEQQHCNIHYFTMNVKKKHLF